MRAGETAFNGKPRDFMGRKLFGRTAAPAADARSRLDQVAGAQGVVRFTVRTAEGAKSHREVKHSDVEQQAEERHRSMQPKRDRGDDENDRNRGERPGENALPIAARVETALDEKQQAVKLDVDRVGR